MKYPLSISNVSKMLIQCAVGVLTIDMSSKGCISQVRPCTEARGVHHGLANPFRNDCLKLTSDLVLEAVGKLYNSGVKDVVRVCADYSRATIRCTEILRYVSNAATLLHTDPAIRQCVCASLGSCQNVPSKRVAVPFFECRGQFGL